MSPLILGIAAFVGVASLVGGVALLFRDQPSTRMEDRLDVLTGPDGTGTGRQDPAVQDSVLTQPLDAMPNLLESLIGKLGDYNRIFEQADTSLRPAQLAAISLGLAVVGAGLGAATGLKIALLPVLGLVMAFVPVAWLFMRRKRRMKAFGVQLPDALELLARALRSGQSLGAGFSMIAQEMSPPIGTEFGKTFEELNLGIPLEESLNDMTERVPNLDLKFFATAIILQRQTGGDLAEILDKIGRLIRERFQIWGQVQALTGEGRLSGIVLMALPVLLFFTVYYLNPDYVSVLFTDPLGKQMLAGGIFLQVLGALVIRKIVNIKV